MNLHLLGGTVEANPAPAIKDVGDKRVAEFRLHDGFGWHNVTIWGKEAEKCPKPGQYVLVKGRVQTRSYDKEINGSTVKQYFTSTNADSIEFPNGEAPTAPTAPASLPDDLGF